MAKFRQPSAAVMAGRARRPAQQVGRQADIEWYIKNVSDKVAMTIEERVRKATEHVRDRVVRNISRPVTKGTGPRGGRVVTNRSKPGEFPKADTVQLMKTTFSEVVAGRQTIDGYVGTPLDYGVILELRMNRSFLVRTLNAERGTVTRILTGPIA